VRVLPVFRELGDVHNPDRDVRRAEHFPDDPHHTLAGAWSPVRQIFDRSCLVVTVPISIFAPIFAPDNKRTKHISIIMSVLLMLGT
jgi:hypothetical protein